MLATARKWADAMRTGSISRQEVWLAMTTTVWHSLCYPLSSINLSKHQCKQLMKPLLQYALPALGVCRTFPRDIVFAPSQFGGLGIRHLYTTQEITLLKDIISHTARGSLLGELYRQSLSTLILEIGLGTKLHQINYTLYGPLVTCSLIKSLWSFFCTHQLDLHHNIDLLPQCLDDQPIMPAITSLNLPPHQLICINRCHLYLHSYWLSDLTDGSGEVIVDNAWLGRPMHPDRADTWPRQGKPSPSD